MSDSDENGQEPRRAALAPVLIAVIAIALLIMLFIAIAVLG